MNFWRRPAVLVVLWSALPGTVCAEPADRAELEALRARVQQLEQQLKTISRQLELKEPAANVTPGPAKVAASDRGFALSSVDDENTIRLRALVQLDSRLFFEEAGLDHSTFVLRRARLITEGAIAKRHTYQFVTEFGGASVSILDANFATLLGGDVQLKAGKFKTPVGLEVLQSAPATSFTERSILSGLLPNRDVGLQLSTFSGPGLISYTIGIFNGVADGTSSTNIDFDNGKDVAARVFGAPFKNGSSPLLRGLSFGIGASEGRHKTAAGRTAGYRTDGQQFFFSYLPGVIADGRAWRVSPQLDYRSGPWGVLGEYVVSSTTLRAGEAGPKRQLRHEGWQVTGGYVLTGEDSTYGQIAPRRDFSPADGTWGAWELFARYATVRIDDAAFPMFAAAGSNATGVRGRAVGFNWFLTKAVVFKCDYYQSDFGLPASAGGSVPPLLRQPEKVLVSRFQLSF
jgi:phosphate-selective porin OprO and OprP